MSTPVIVASVVGIVFMYASAVRWNLPVKRYAWIISVAGAGGVIVGMLLSPFLADWATVVYILSTQAVVYIGSILWLFYRDPERNPPASDDVIVSPSDGKVIYKKSIPKGEMLEINKERKQALLSEFDGTEFTQHDLYQIGIALMFTDVHVNRAPTGGKVKRLIHRPGKFLSLRDLNAINVNERNTVILESTRGYIAVVQIASRLVRRIVSYVKEGEEINKGERIGMIKFGSQVDVFIPADIVGRLEVEVDQYLYAGETVLCRFRA